MRKLPRSGVPVKENARSKARLVRTVNRRTKGRRGRRGTRGTRPGRRVFFYVPANLDAATVVSAAGLAARFAGFLNYWVHLVVVGGVMRKADRRGYVRLKAKYLRKVIPVRALPTVRKLAVEAGVIEWDRRYEKGRKSMGYRLAEAYRVETRRVQCRDLTVAAKVRRLRETEFYTEPEGPVHRHLLRDLGRVTIDREGAMATVLASDKLRENLHIHATVIDMIASGHVEFSHDKYGRVHSLITRMAKELRPYLRIDGKPLVNVDVACSQPLMLALTILLARTALSSKQDIDKSDAANTTNTPQPNTPHTQPPQTHTNQAHTNTVCILAPISTQIPGDKDFTARTDCLGDDERQFLELCENGTLYEFVRENAGLQHVERGRFKHRFFRDVMYDQYHSDRPMMRAFERLFPNVVRFIRDAKRWDYRELARRMQRVESGLMIGTVCRRLMEEYPHVPILTIHDSIMTTPEHAPVVQAVMAEEFAKVGLRPTLRVECAANAGERVAA